MSRRKAGGKKVGVPVNPTAMAGNPAIAPSPSGMDRFQHPCPLCSLHCQRSDWIASCSTAGRFDPEGEGKGGAVSLASSGIRAWVSGVEMPLEDAIGLWHRWWEGSRSRAIGGVPADVQATRALLRLAERSEAIWDLWASEATWSAIEGLQRDGATLTTFAEVRRYCQQIWVLGDDRLLDGYPMLPEHLRPERKVISPGDSRETLQETWLIGSWSVQAKERFEEAGHRVMLWESELERLPHGLLALRQERLAQAAAGSRATHGVVVVDPDLLDVSMVGVWLEQWRQWCGLSPETDRWSTLLLRGVGAGDREVSVWTTGYPGRVRFEGGAIDYDPQRWSMDRWIEPARVESLLWVEGSVAGWRVDCSHPLDRFPVDRLAIAAVRPTEAMKARGRFCFQVVPSGWRGRVWRMRADGASMDAVGPWLQAAGGWRDDVSLAYLAERLARGWR